MVHFRNTHQFLLPFVQILDTPPADAIAATTSSSKKAITEEQAKKLAQKEGAPHLSLSEVGPRFVLNPVKIFEGSFNGACIYENKGILSHLSRSTTRKPALIIIHFFQQSSSLLRHSLLRNVSTERRSTVLARDNKRSARYAWRRLCLDTETILWRSERCSLDLVRLVRDFRGFSFPLLLVSLVLYITYLRKLRCVSSLAVVMCSSETCLATLRDGNRKV